MPTYEAHPQTSGWHQHPASTVLSRYVGRLRPPGGNRGPHGESPADFLVVAPTTIATERVVVVMFTQPTSSSAIPANRIYDPHNYPGDPNNLDLYAQGPEVDTVLRNLALPASPYRLIGVQFVPRTSQRPLLFVMQRLRQVRLAVLDLLLQRYGLDPENVAVTVTCASFGGLTAPLAPLFYPLEFHSATGTAYSGAHRSMPSDFDSHVFSTSLLGLDVSANAYNMRDTVDFMAWCRAEQTDFASLSFTNRWYKGHIQRPTYFLIGDEDMVSHGTDWLQILTGTNAANRTQPQSGTHTLHNVFQRDVDVHWSLVSKQGHSEPRNNGFTLEGVQPPIQTDDLRLPLELMIEAAYQQLFVSSTLIHDIDDLALGRKIVDPALPSQDPSRVALGHSGQRTYTAGSNSLFLTEDPAFRRYGQGTWLGANESLKVKLLPNDTCASVFVGSADGYVTRLQMAPRGSPSIEPLVEVARTKLTNGTPYALGHGTWGLDIGDIDPNLPGHEVAVASYDRVALFDAQNLVLIREVSLPSWEYTNPRKLQVADVWSGGGEEIVFRTLHNHLVIMSHDLLIKFEHQEAGIIDLAIGPTPTPRANNALLRPIYLLSARGHIVRLEFDQSLTATNAGVLAGVSSLEYGGMRDLDVVTHLNQTRLAALFVPHLGATDAIRFFSVDDCDKVGEFGNIMALPQPEQETLPSVLHADAGGDMEPSFTSVAGHGGERS